MTTADNSRADFAAQAAERFNMLCLAALLPDEIRLAALDEWVGADPDLFQLGFSPPPVVSAAVAAAGTRRTRIALAVRSSDPAVQRSLVALDDPAIDDALNSVHLRAYDVERLLRLRAPERIATGFRYRADHHHRALTEGDPLLAAAALLDRRSEQPRRSWPGDAPVGRLGRPEPTALAFAWRTVREYGGTDAVRTVLARVLTTGPAEGLTAEIADALDGPDPELRLRSVEERRLGTGALLGRLRVCKDTFESRHLLDEPFRPDWALIRADVLRLPLPTPAVHALVHHPDCPPDTAFLLVHGRPPQPGEVDAWSREQEARRAARGGPHLPGRSTGSLRPDLGTGPLGPTAEDAVRVLRALPMSTTGELRWFHVENAVERGLLSAWEVVEYGTEARSVISWLGQTSALHMVDTAPHSGIALAHGQVRAHLAAWCERQPPPADMWQTVRGMIRGFPGTLPELLREADRRAGADRQAVPSD